MNSQNRRLWSLHHLTSYEQPEQKTLESPPHYQQHCILSNVHTSEGQKGEEHTEPQTSTVSHLLGGWTAAWVTVQQAAITKGIRAGDEELPLVR